MNFNQLPNMITARGTLQLVISSTHNIYISSNYVSCDWQWYIKNGNSHANISSNDVITSENQSKQTFYWLDLTITDISLTYIGRSEWLVISMRITGIDVNCLFLNYTCLALTGLLLENTWLILNDQSYRYIHDLSGLKYH